MRLKARDLMCDDLITLQADESLDLADEVMRLARIRHLPVTDDKAHLVGLVTHRDLLKAQVSALAGLGTNETRKIERTIPVARIMNQGITTISGDTPALDAARLIRDNKYGCLPVVEDGKLVGILTEADFVDLVIRALEDESGG
jgi:CBS domain-containing membrane protein